jgi:hypothetical protein
MLGALVARIACATRDRVPALPDCIFAIRRFKREMKNLLAT